MRDLREALQARINELEVRSNEMRQEFDREVALLEANLETGLKELSAEREAVERLFAIEQRRFGQVDNGNLKHHGQIQPLAEFLVTCVKHGAADKDDLREAAVRAGYFPQGESGGRQVHFTLLNLVRGNRLQEFEPARYCIPASKLDALDMLNIPEQEPTT